MSRLAIVQLMVIAGLTAGCFGGEQLPPAGGAAELAKGSAVPSGPTDAVRNAPSMRIDSRSLADTGSFGFAGAAYAELEGRARAGGAVLPPETTVSPPPKPSPDCPKCR
jgi:hypothetical protein